MNNPSVHNCDNLDLEITVIDCIMHVHYYFSRAQDTYFAFIINANIIKFIFFRCVTPI